MTKKIKKSAVLAVIMAVMIYATAVMAYASWQTGRCGHNNSSWTYLERQQRNATAYTETGAHGGHSVTVYLTMRWIATNGIIHTETDSGSGSVDSFAYTSMPPGTLGTTISASSTHVACGSSSNRSA